MTYCFCFYHKNGLNKKNLIAAIYKCHERHSKFDKIINEIQNTPTDNELILMDVFIMNFLDNTKTTRFLSKLEYFNKYRLPIDNTRKSHNAIYNHWCYFFSAEFDYNYALVNFPICFLPTRFYLLF